MYPQADSGADEPLGDALAQKPAMDEKKLLAILGAFEQESFGFATGDLAQKRAYAVERYLCEPLGNEVDGRSAVIDSGLRDTIEWIMPQSLRVFLSGDDVVKFEPIGPDDEAAAQQETRYVNHVILEKNDAFNVFSTWFRDALMAKNGYVRANWRERHDIREETYNGLTEDTLTVLLGDPEVEIVDARSYPDPDAPTTMPAADAMSMGMGPMSPPKPPMLYDVRVKTKHSTGYVQIDNVAPEEVRVHKSVRGISLQDSPYTEFRTQKSVSELRQEGYLIEDDDADDFDAADDTEEIEQARDRFGDDTLTDTGSSDPASRIVWFKESYARVDFDGDGIAELRRICRIGNKIAKYEDGSPANEYADLVQMAAITPIVFPHKHVGLGYDDLCNMPSLVKTAQMRAYLDNLNLANNGRYAADPTLANIDDILNSRPGGVIRTQGDPRAAVMPITHPVTGEVTLRGLEWADSWRESSTGVSAYYQGLNADSLNKTATGISQIMTASQGRVEAVIRSFATGVKELFAIVHALTLKNATSAEKAKINGEWVTVDPREWRKRTAMSITVGLGTGTRESRIAQLMQLAQMQTQGVQIGIVKPQNLFNTGKRITEEMGYRNAEEFWTDPAKQEQQPPQKSPEEKAAEAMAAGQVKAKEIDGQTRIAVSKQDNTTKMAGDVLDAFVKLLINRREMTLEQQQTALEAFAKRYQTDREHAARAQEHADGLASQAMQHRDKMQAQQRGGM